MKFNKRLEELMNEVDANVKTTQKDMKAISGEDAKAFLKDIDAAKDQKTKDEVIAKYKAMCKPFKMEEDDTSPTPGEDFVARLRKMLAKTDKDAEKDKPKAKPVKVEETKEDNTKYTELANTIQNKKKDSVNIANEKDAIKYVLKAYQKICDKKDFDYEFHYVSDVENNGQSAFEHFKEFFKKHL